MLLPKPYPDEIVGSVIVRACQHSKLPLKRLLESVFGAQRSYYSFLMTSNLRRLGLLTGLSEEELLLNHTVFRYAVAFMPAALQRELMLRALGQGNPYQLAALTKNAARGVRCFRFCPHCAQYEQSAYGETYWHRAHLLPGVSLCVVHGTWLQEVSAPQRRQVQTAYMLLPGQTQAMAPPCIVDTAMMNRFTLLSKEAAEGRTPTEANWPERYRALAAEMGYLTRAGEVGGTLLTKALVKYFTTSFLDPLACGIRIAQTNSWPALMVRHDAGVPFSPVKHLLLNTFFAAGISALNAGVAHAFKPGRRLPEFAQLDERLARMLTHQIAFLREKNERMTVKDLLSTCGILQTVRHHRDKIPTTAAVLEEFRRSDQSERQLGGRAYWRDRLPSRYRRSDRLE